MRASHGFGSMSACFDESNLIGSAGLVLAAGLMARIGLPDLSGDHVRIAGVANAEAKVSSLVLGMIAGGDGPVRIMDGLGEGPLLGDLFDGGLAHGRRWGLASTCLVAVWQ